MGLLQLLSAGNGNESAEERFVADKSDERWGGTVSRVFLVFATLTVACGQLLCFFMPAEIRTETRLAFTLALAADLGWLLGIRRTRLTVQHYVVFVHYFTTTIFLACAYGAMRELAASPVPLALAPAFFLACITAMIAQSPASTRTAVLMAVYAHAGGIVAFGPEKVVLHLAAAGLYASALGLRNWQRNTFRKRALWEYRSRLVVAPYPVVYRSIMEDKLVDEALTPSLRTCIFLLTELDAPTAPSELRDACAVCAELMRRHYPQRNYFFDWIAGELFIVAYLEDGQDLQALLAASVALAKELTAPSARGAAITRDVGISSGEAFVGIMGPDGMRKATAQGEAAGRARRLQAAGRYIAPGDGQRARIVIEGGLTPRVAAVCGPAALRIHRIAADEAVRDYDDDALHYIA